MVGRNSVSSQTACPRPNNVPGGLPHSKSNRGLWPCTFALAGCHYNLSAQSRVPSIPGVCEGGAQGPGSGLPGCGTQQLPARSWPSSWVGLGPGASSKTSPFSVLGPSLYFGASQSHSSIGDSQCHLFKSSGLWITKERKGSSLWTASAFGPEVNISRGPGFLNESLVDLHI